MSSAAAMPPPAKARRGNYLRRRGILWFYIFVGPWILGFLLVQAGPISAAIYSWRSTDGLQIQGGL